MEKKVNIEMVVMKISRSKNLHDEETPWVTGSDYKTMLRNKKRELQLPVGRKMPARNSTDIAPNENMVQNHLNIALLNIL